MFFQLCEIWGSTKRVDVVQLPSAPPESTPQGSKRHSQHLQTKHPPDKYLFTDLQQKLYRSKAGRLVEW